MHRIVSALMLCGLSLALGGAVAPTSQANQLLVAKRQAAEAERRSELLERQASRYATQAQRARGQASALAARIEAAEADITAAEVRIRLVEALRADQRARLASRQGPVIRLTAALQTMARRPPALALVQPGSLDQLVHVRSLLASTLPVIRARTASLRAEVARGDMLRRQADRAVAGLTAMQEQLKSRRIAFARLEQRERARSETLMLSAANESDRALAFGEEARELATLAGTRAFQASLQQNLSALPGPRLRPGSEQGTAQDRTRAGPSYVLPVEGRVITGMGEISDAGVHARGLKLQTVPEAEVVSPAGGRVAYAGRFRHYGEIVIIDHGGGWISAVTNLGSLSVKPRDRVSRGSPIGRAAEQNAEVGVELRRNGRPFPIAPLLALR